MVPGGVVQSVSVCAILAYWFIYNSASPLQETNSTCLEDSNNTECTTTIPDSTNDSSQARGFYNGYYGHGHGIHGGYELEYGHRYRQYCRKGTCSTPYECTAAGGHIKGHCFLTDHAIGVCCVVEPYYNQTEPPLLPPPPPPNNTCGGVTTDLEAIFQNPEFPNPTPVAAVCTFTIIAAPGICGISIQFGDFNLTPGIDGNCYRDVMMILTVPSSTYNTPFCGLIQGSATMVEVAEGSRVSTVIVTQTPTSYWRIGFRQISCTATSMLPDEEACGIRNGRQFSHRFRKFPWYKENNIHTDISRQHMLTTIKRPVNKKQEEDDTEGSDDDADQKDNLISAIVTGNHNSFHIPASFSFKPQSLSTIKPLNFESMTRRKIEELKRLVEELSQRKKAGESKWGSDSETEMDTQNNENKLEIPVKIKKPVTFIKLPTRQQTTSSTTTTTVRPLSQETIRTPFQDETEKSDEDRNRILGGNPLVPNQFPWMVVILEDGDLQCGGTLINHEWVLTAGHCFGFSSPTPLVPRFTVYLGAYNITDPNEQLRTQIPVRQIVTHPGHITATRDIAMIRLGESVKYTRVARPLCLNFEGDSEKQALAVIIAGWGQTENMQNSPVPRAAFVNIVDKQTCQQIWGTQEVMILDYMICTGTQTAGTCPGDSGGTLFGEGEDGLYFGIGITSFGTMQCGPKGFPDVFTRISSFRDWILLVLAT